jgi:hypothetical protein
MLQKVLQLYASKVLRKRSYAYKGVFFLILTILFSLFIKISFECLNTLDVSVIMQVEKLFRERSLLNL